MSDTLPSIDDLLESKLPSVEDFITEDKIKEELPSVDEYIVDVKEEVEHKESDLPSVEDKIVDENLPTIEDYIEEEEKVEEEIETTGGISVQEYSPDMQFRDYEFIDIIKRPEWKELVGLVNEVRDNIPDIPEIKYYDDDLEKITETIEEIRSEIPVVPEVKYYDEDIQEVKQTISDLPEVKYYDEEVAQLDEKINNLPVVKYYDDDLNAIKDKFNYEIQQITENIEVKDFESRVDVDAVKTNLKETTDKIYEELKELNNSETKLVAKLLNAKNQIKLEEIFKEHKIDIVYHAAAYKHVPLVEINKIEGIRNNLATTKAVSMAAITNNIEKVVLISSDKAVRPTNIMGATKLLSELMIKELSSLSNCKTIFSTVRFGNVIDSSGSVIPLFRNQIKTGGPLTITHQDMERYFMTISEAVNLVLHASVLMKGGETFVLDMGKRIKIMDLAKKMLKMSGLTIKDINNKMGDIEIKFTGIRPGEKIKEELIYNGILEKTVHPLINIAKEEI